MLNILSHLRSEKPEITDARRIYRKIMQSSRNPEFFGDGKCADTMTGRMEILCLHLGVMHYVLRFHGDNGKALGQALYDVMIADFDTALREEGLSDSGLKRRIKPMAKMFYIRIKNYAEALSSDDQDKEIKSVISKFSGKEDSYTNSLTAYIKAIYSMLKPLSLGEIAKAKFQFPKKL